MRKDSVGTSGTIPTATAAARPECKLEFDKRSSDLIRDEQYFRKLYVCFGNAITVNGVTYGGSLARIDYDTRIYGGRPFKFTITGTATEWTAAGNPTTGSWNGVFPTAASCPYDGIQANITSSNTPNIAWCPETGSYTNIGATGSSATTLLMRAYVCP